MRRFGGLLGCAALVASSCLLPSVEVSDSLSGAGSGGAAAGTSEVVGGEAPARAGAASASAGATSASAGANAAGGAAPIAGATADAGAAAGGDGAFVPDATAPSCAGLSKTACHGESCCTRLPVPACDGCAFPPGNTTHLSAFSLDKYEVTVARFRAFGSQYILREPDL